MKVKEYYKKLIGKAKELRFLDTISMLVGWDYEVNLPPKSVEQRSEQMSYISELSHRELTDSDNGQLIKQIMEHPDYETLTEREQRNVYIFKREYDRAIKLPVEFVKERAAARVKSIEIWKKAKKTDDFKLFLPALKKMFEFAKKHAEYLDPDAPVYDTLLDLYEPGMTVAQYNSIFSPLKEATVEILDKIVHAEKQPDTSILSRTVPKDIQEKLAHDVMPVIGYDLQRGRLDTAVHPFTTGFYDDVRITTRYMEDFWPGCFFAVLHEAGHAIYEQNQNPKWKYEPVGGYCSMGIHESQSRFHENTLGRSKEFWKFYYDKFKELTDEIFDDVAFDDFILAINKVEPSLIRVEADEVTYNLHIILRFELERDLFEGKIKIEDLADTWKDKMHDLLGIEVPNDTLGVLQDTHWAGGMFGYFPTYALGNVYAAQLMHKMAEDIPKWREELSTGNLDGIAKWLQKHVHETGDLYDAPVLIKKITGKEPSHIYLVEYFKEKYYPLYC